MSAGLNCRPGDLARIVGIHSTTGLNGFIVQLAEEPVMVTQAGPHWRLERPVFFRITVPSRDILGNVFMAGDNVEVGHIADANLRPIRDPGPDAVDEILQLVGAPVYSEVFA